MTLSISQLMDRVGTKFPEAELVGDSILRFMKKRSGSPYAVYYIDVTHDLPQSQEALAKYQDRVIGKYYFKDRKSLQWSNYLYFVTQFDRLASEEVRKAKELIERDRSYARKFVISEENLDSILVPPVVAPADSAPHATILTVWTELLTKAGLGKAIMSDEDLPTRLKLIESSHAVPFVKYRVQKHKETSNDESFINHLHLNKFRSFPNKRSFTFGTVNLIFGANGTGKTSLLEAIEYFYCGKNKRNPDVRSDYDIAAVFANGKSENTTADLSLQIFRDRNHAWYGQPEIKTNNLYQSFAQYNFLDTDAAVSLADSTSRIQEDLSKLLVGPDASKIWQNIERVSEAVVGKIRDLSSLEVQISGELDSLDKQINESSKISLESNSIFVRLEEMLNRIGWNNQDIEDNLVADYVESTSELISIAQQALNINFIESPVTINNMNSYYNKAINIIDKVEENTGIIREYRISNVELENEINNNNELLDIAKEAKKIISLNLQTNSLEYDECTDLITRYSILLSDYNESYLNKLSTMHPDKKLSDGYDEVISSISSVEKSLTSTKLEYEKLAALRDELINLKSELRHIATKVISNTVNKDECPLCHTSFEVGELSKRINTTEEDNFGLLGNMLLDDIAEKEERIKNSSVLREALIWLKNFCKLTNLEADISLRKALSQVKLAKSKLSEAQKQSIALYDKIQGYEKQGISIERLEKITRQLLSQGYNLTEHPEKTIDGLIADIEKAKCLLDKELEANKEHIKSLNNHNVELFNSIMLEDTKRPNSQSHIKEGSVLIKKLLEMLQYFTVSKFPWPGDRPLTELIVEAESIRKVAIDIQTVIDKQKQATDLLTNSIKRRDSLKPKHDEAKLRLKRYKEVQATLKSIKRDHSLMSAMDATLNDNRSSIESIFKSIHSPVEFSGLGSNWTTLVRQADASGAKLSEISTGQRAAFALSIFLAQNALLKEAPPVILIDDPIAHVDDLNSLSFIDYLREIVLQGHRQIFFATADDKLASLFQRKFDFMGPDEFCRINLSRES